MADHDHSYMEKPTTAIGTCVASAIPFTFETPWLSVAGTKAETPATWIGLGCCGDRRCGRCGRCCCCCCGGGGGGGGRGGGDGGGGGGSCCCCSVGTVSCKET